MKTNQACVLLFVFSFLASLACRTVTEFANIPNPEGLATDAFLPTIKPSTWTPPPKFTTTPGPSPTPQPTLAAEFADLTQFEAALRPEFADDAARFPHATRYVIDVTVTFNADGSATLSGRERLRYTNQQAFALNEIYLMLWPNHREQYLSQMTLNAVRVNGQEVEPILERAGLAARIDLAGPLEPGASVEVSAEFVIEAYPGIDTSGAARFGLTNGVLLAPTFYPLVPRIAAGGQWQTQPAPSGGDTTNSDTSFYLWRITAPADVTIIGSGTLISTTQTPTQTQTATQTQTLVTGPMRDLALVVGPLEKTQRVVGEVTLNAYLLAENSTYRDEMLDYAEGQLKTLQDKVGPYPFEELDLVDAPGAFGGIEYPGVVFIGVVGEGGAFESAVVHEVGHQWFYSLIGNDQLQEPWLDEAAASYTEVLYQEAVNGQSAEDQTLREFERYLTFTDHPDLPIGQPVDDYSFGDYGVIVYGKGALFFNALRQQLGDEKFFTFLQAYYAEYRYGFATSAGFQEEAEQACTCDMDALFDLWVYEGGKVGLP